MTTLAIVLTGGRSSRMGGRHKPAIPVGGRTIVDRVIAAVRGADSTSEIVIAGSAEGVGDTTSREDGIRVAREDPPFSGPLAGVAAGLAAVPPARSRTVLILGGDMPHLDAAFLRALTEQAAEGAIAIARDETGRDQFLCAAWPERVLRRRISELDAVADAPLRSLYDHVRTSPSVAPAGSLRDVDSPGDLEAL
ncbi:molybdenum cofactor guanylyltransferase [Microbacterium karelineae]|uniref:molybdenum cofactor guanylyltransferase n=1 Tax=Microbacterium karelineae TaxID=2654283 RepID=UPI0012E9FB83|nr:molybdenum cofactor guanylyltransferase [Microbacterium karelineae]